MCFLMLLRVQESLKKAIIKAETRRLLFDMVFICCLDLFSV